MNDFLSHPMNRRSMLSRCGMGLGALGLPGLLHDDGLLGAANPLAPKQSHFPARAKSVIWSMAVPVT